MRVTGFVFALIGCVGCAQGVPGGALEFRAAGGGAFDGHAGDYSVRAESAGMTTPAGQVVFLGADRNAAFSAAPSEVRYKNVYPGIDLVYHSHAGRLEYDFVVAPGADPAAIAFTIRGAALEVGLDRNLTARTAAGSLLLDAPEIYQLARNGSRRLIAGGYRIERDCVRFHIADYDQSQPLIIDPVLSYSSWYGQSGDGISAATADSAGNAYLVGRANPGLILVEKVGPTGTLISRVTLGTSSYSFDAEAVAVTSSGVVYIVGTADAGLPTTSNAYIASVTSGNHAFIAVLNSSLALTYCSYIAGTTSAGDQANGIAIDSSGNAYIAGYTVSSTFPVTSGAFQTTLSGSGQSGFLCKINPLASGAASLVYSTYLGGPATSTELYDVAIDSANNAYVTGLGGSDFPVTAGTYQYDGIALGSGGVFVTKLNSTATALDYSAYLGYGVGVSIAVDGSTDAYVTGYAEISDFPTTAGAYQVSYPGAFALELNATGTSLIYSTFLTGPSSAVDYTEAIPARIALAPGCTSACAAYISGYTNAVDFPVVAAIQTFNASAATGGNDDFIVQLAGNGATVAYSTYFGGSSDESSNGGFPHLPGIGVLTTGDVVIGGETQSDDLPVTIENPPIPIFSARINAAAASEPTEYPVSLSFGTQTVSVPSAAQSVTLRNMGTSALTAAVAASGDYSQTNTCGSSLAGGTECVISVVFTPTSTSNPRTGSITLNSASIVNLTGSGENAGYASMTPTTVTFAGQTVGTAAPAQTVTYTNIGNAALTLSASSFGVSGDYAQTNNCPASLSPNTSCTISVSFLPTEEGYRSGSISVSAGNNASPNNSVTISGVGLAGTAQLTLNGAGLVFNPQTVGTTSSSQTIDILNSGNVPFTVLSVVASGDFAASGCVESFNPGGGCGVRVTFTPTAAGTRTGIVTITDTTPASPHTFTLTGTGLAQSSTITITPAALDFPDQAVEQVSRAIPIYVTNTGTTPVTFDRIVESGDYRITSNSCGTLAVRTPPATCTVYVTFTPTAAGARTGSIVFTDSATGSPQTVTLTGNGLADNDTLTISPAELDFGSEAVGLTTFSQYVVISNSGNVPVTLTTGTITGTNAGDFTQANSCTGGTLSPLRTCQFGIAFVPTATGSRTATFSFTDASGTQTVALAGTGEAADLAASFVPASMTFQAQATGTTSPNQSLYVVNTGDEPLTISSIGISGPFTLVSNPCDTTIQPNAGCALIVNYVPTGSTGTQTGTLTFTDNAGTQTVNLSGQNVASAPALKLSPAGLAYDVEPIGTAANAQTVTLSNTSASTLTGISVGAPTLTDFTIANNNCGTSLASNGTCSFQVNFTPTAAGSRVATVSIANSAANQTLSLAGFGEAATLSAYLRDDALVFPSQVIATTSGNQTITFVNNGLVPLTISSVAISTGDFAISNDCPVSPSTLAANQSCQVSVTFTPTAAGNRTATVTITDNAPGSPSTVSISGQGLTATETLESNYTSLVFPTESIGDTANQPNPETITLTNTGNSPVTISSITSSSAQYVVNNGCPLTPSTLAPNGGQCQVAITFTPSKAATEKGTLTISSSASTKALTISMTGAGVADTSTVNVTPTTIAFIPQTVGTTSGFTEAVYVTNAGDENITVSSVTVTTGFSLNNGCTGVLAPANYCEVEVSFTPTEAKATTGTLTIATTGKPATTKVSLSGTGISSNNSISLSQTNVVFDQQVVGVASQPQEIYYFNQGATSVTISSVVLTGADFSMSNGCSGTGGPLTSCGIKVTFKPTTTGLRTGTVVITDSDPGSPRTINLSGTGVTAAAPQANVSPTSLTFASQPVGTTSAAQNINVTNSGEANLTISGIGVSGANAAQFPQTNNCPASLAPSFSCVISVKFAPTSVGSATATLSVADNASGSPQTVSLTGTGATGTTPVVTFTPSSLTFANVPINTASAPQTATLQNTGAAPLTISGIAASGTVSGDFAQSNNCPASLAVGASCTITVTFTPTSVINQTGAVTVTDNTPNGSDTLPLAGNGTAPEVNLSATTLAFGNQATGTTSAAKTVTLENAGNLALTITSIAATKDYNIVSNNCPSSLGPGLTCTFSVTFSPSITGADNGSVTITDNAGDSPQVITLTGSGT